MGLTAFNFGEKRGMVCPGGWWSVQEVGVGGLSIGWSVQEGGLSRGQWSVQEGGCLSQGAVVCSGVVCQGRLPFFTGEVPFFTGVSHFSENGSPPSNREYSQCAVGMYRTGKHSCSLNIFASVLLEFNSNVALKCLCFSQQVLQIFQLFTNDAMNPTTYMVEI